MGGVFSSYTTDDNILTLWSWCQRLENEINTINARTNQGNNSQTDGSSTDFQSLSRRFDDFNKENSRMREDITALSVKIDEDIAKISHWEGALEVLSGKFHDALTAEVNTMNAKYQALSIRVENGFHDSPPAINRGLALGLSLGLGIPLTIALIFLCAMWIRRKYPYIPQHANNEEAENYIKIHKATRQKTLTEKLCDLFETLDFKKKQIVPEVYVMDNTPKKG